MGGYTNECVRGAIGLDVRFWLQMNVFMDVKLLHYRVFDDI